MGPSPMRVLGFHHLALKVGQVEAVARFYCDVLALVEIARHHRPDGSLRSVWLALSEADPANGFLAIEAADAEAQQGTGRGLTLLALRIDRAERARAMAELQRRGIEVVHQTRWTIYFHDPEG